MSELRRRMLFASKENVIGSTVDLGLPSGLLWATGNIVPDGNGYKIGKETDYGVYVSWGNVEPHLSSNNSTFDNNYNWGTSNTGNPYKNTPGASISLSSGESFAPSRGYDAARVLLGDGWMMPTADDCQELYDNCTSEWVTVNGITGRRFTSNINGKSVFFPAAGYGRAYTLYNSGTSGSFYTRTFYSSDEGYYLFVNSSYANPKAYSGGRHIGMPVRAVTMPSAVTTNTYVDLGLSVKWANGNICKYSNRNYYVGEPTDIGCYFSWGNVIGHKRDEGYRFTDSNYSSTPGASLTANIASNDPVHDAARACLGGSWRMPTKEEFQELCYNCTSTWVTSYNGVSVVGRIFKSNKAGYTDAEIFIPAAGFYRDRSLLTMGTLGLCWSSSYYNFNSAGYDLYFDSSRLNPQDYSCYRYFGLTVRAVCS